MRKRLHIVDMTVLRSSLSEHNGHKQAGRVTTCINFGIPNDVLLAFLGSVDLRAILPLQKAPMSCVIGEGIWLEQLEGLWPTRPSSFTRGTPPPRSPSCLSEDAARLWQAAEGDEQSTIRTLCAVSAGRLPRGLYRIVCSGRQIGQVEMVPPAKQASGFRLSAASALSPCSDAV